MKKYITAVIVYRNDDGELDNGIFPKTVNNSFEIESGTAKVKSLYEERIYTVENIIDFLPLTVSGATYQERKNDLYEKALTWCNAERVACWSYGELAEIESFFRTNGKRYGLLKEFEENAIC